MPVEVCLSVGSYRGRLLTGKPFIGFFLKLRKNFTMDLKFIGLQQVMATPLNLSLRQRP